MFQTVPQIYTPQSPPSPPTDNMLSVPSSTTVPTGPNGQPKPRKMRASCDACSRAKVKCDKVRPTCQRCGNMSICCNYSPSMRYFLLLQRRFGRSSTYTQIQVGEAAQEQES